MKWIFIAIGILILLVALVYLIGSSLEVKHKVTIERKFKANVDEIWLLITNFKDYAKWRSGIKELTIDSTYSWTEVSSHGDRVTYQLQILDDKKKLITKILNKDLAYGGFWEFEITALKDGCLLQITENGEVYNPIFRFMSKFIFGHEATLKNYVTDLEAEVANRPK